MFELQRIKKLTKLLDHPSLSKCLSAVEELIAIKDKDPMITHPIAH